MVALLFWCVSIFENLHDFCYEGGASINDWFSNYVGKDKDAWFNFIDGLPFSIHSAECDYLTGLPPKAA